MPPLLKLSLSLNPILTAMMSQTTDKISSGLLLLTLGSLMTMPRF
jgi:hypothetical protein